MPIFRRSAVLRVATGVAEAAELFDHMLLVTEFPAIAREIGSEARSTSCEHHALDPVARRYWEALVRRCLISLRCFLCRSRPHRRRSQLRL